MATAEDGRATARPRDRAKIVALVAVLMMILGSLLARTINTDGGSTSVTETTIFGADGHQISAHVYTPKSASATHRLPGIAMWHGLNNQKEYMSNTALKLARRGFVVVSADQTGHGSSTGANLDTGCGGPDVLTYLRGLTTVDTQRSGLVGSPRADSARPPRQHCPSLTTTTRSSTWSPSRTLPASPTAPRS